MQDVIVRLLRSERYEEAMSILCDHHGNPTQFGLTLFNVELHTDPNIDMMLERSANYNHNSVAKTNPNIEVIRD